MNPTVIGAPGRTGRHVLGHAVRRGHRVTAVTRADAAAVVLGAVEDPAPARTAVDIAGA